VATDPKGNGEANWVVAPVDQLTGVGIVTPNAALAKTRNTPATITTLLKAVRIDPVGIILKGRLASICNFV